MQIGAVEPRTLVSFSRPSHALPKAISAITVEPTTAGMPKYCSNIAPEPEVMTMPTRKQNSTEKISMNVPKYLPQ